VQGLDASAHPNYSQRSLIAYNAEKSWALGQARRRSDILETTPS
jgi:hypothetical protein